MADTIAPKVALRTDAAIAPEGRRLLRVEARNAETPIESKPSWLRTKAVVSETYQDVRGLVREKNLHTVCAEANCPNIYECWNDREATFLVGGEICTRRCDFCDIATGRPTEYDVDEPRRVAVSIKEMELRYATVTGVARDDRPDGGAWLYAETCRQIHELSPGTGVELLIPDFKGDPGALAEVYSSRPEVLGHNVETVPRIHKRIRPAFSYERSLDVIRSASEAGLVTKSNLILGMGETREEIEEAMAALVEARCDILTITQYLRPSKLHHPIDRWVKPQEFIELSSLAEEMGFAAVMSGPMVRSSYRAGMLWGRAVVKRGWEVPEHLRSLTEPTTARQEASALLAPSPALAAAS
ncbi:lipoyl synthase [Actinomyces sp. Chiba101]|uniref:lipoyl synthase n=1 Tax=Actinomyces TaxID=1654 RepID=UPI000974F441|nr:MULTISPECIES: lipoyl synthase [Actinomyces]BAW93250.1 lipoyl synthase [Actinomyces sp. Chiba101]GAV95516.1 lipoyl synthase [Actinomyces denticolens]SUU04093.1 Lipoyl synthase [Actinomyces denticolens]